MKKLFIWIFILFYSCNSSDDYIRNVYVNIEIPITQPEYTNLQAIGNSMFVTGGVKGIIIYHSEINTYKAFDRNCSFQPSEVCSKIDSINSTIASCGCCSSKFLLDQGGIAVNGPALLPLKEYYTSMSGNILKIQN